MTTRRRTWRGTLPRAVLLAVSVALIPLPAAAGEAGTSSKAPALKMAMSKIVARDLASAKPAPAVARRAEQGNPAAHSPAFFKTRAGMLVAAVMVVGSGYAIYSAQHDRVHSAGKK